MDNLGLTPRPLIIALQSMNVNSFALLCFDLTLRWYTPALARGPPRYPILRIAVSAPLG